MNNEYLACGIDERKGIVTYRMVAGWSWEGVVAVEVMDIVDYEIRR